MAALLHSIGVFLEEYLENLAADPGAWSAVS